ncbi:arginine decarboxylase [Sporolactobacillus inulinus]|uniref:Arginine decarboxylase n=1 Tax=Sporolactobacillus inulinus TaxID=2078 RepID=A0A4Y1ZEL0_9BACL|nr:arginine decarboxylase [Sporolactobacillus inulinus]
MQSMVMSACKRGEKIIMPRNVHRSAINALILSGAIPIYVNPGVNHELGISLGMSVADVKQAILENPDAKAVLINNPTYYGICSNLKAITELAHQHNMLVLVDEAHGTHFYFGEGLPASAMSVGADMAAVSMHKSGGSLTQSSLLLVNGLSEGYVRQIINLTQTTSGSYLLISSLDISRRNLALRGRAIFEKVAQMAEYARAEINQIGGYYAYGRELINGDSIYDFDRTKLSVLTRDIGLAGIEVYDILRDEYDIQIEFGDIGNILAYLSIGDRIMDLERLVSALSEIKRRYAKDRTGMLSQEYIRPEVILAPQEAFYAASESTRLEDSLGRICGEFVMCYPPGIPILAPGEKVTAKVLEYIQYAKGKRLLPYRYTRQSCKRNPDSEGVNDLDLWFTEKHTNNVKLSIKVDRQVYSAQSEFQRIDIFDSLEFGRFLTLDGYMMLTEKDEFIYHEMIVHVPMAILPQVNKVLVIGGGDGGAVRELVRYPEIQQIDLVEIDAQVIEACKNICRKPQQN